MIDIFRPEAAAPTGRALLFASAASTIVMALGLLAGCAVDRQTRTPDVGTAIRQDLTPVEVARPLVVPPRISEVLAEPTPVAVAPLPEPRLDLLVNNAQAREVFLAIVADTRYSMLMHPDVTGTLSVTLRGVTVQEALEAIRDVYGYDFKFDGRRITIYAPTLQTRIFTVNYPYSQRTGKSELHTTAGGGMQSGGSSSGTGGGAQTAASTTGGGQQGGEASRLSTTSKIDFWTELTGAAKGLIGSGPGRSVTVSPQAGIMAVRAMPEELRAVDKFLKAAQIAIERQVMLEAKIVEVELRDGFQSGIDWSALRNGNNSTGAMGVIGGSRVSPIGIAGSNTDAITSTNALVRGVQDNLPGFSAATPLLADGIPIPGAGFGMFGLAFARQGFQAVLGFLETQGDVQILSSPRIATLNNQKAVLKVGTEDFFVTNLTAGVAATNTTAATMPTPTLAQFFSGISLDVTPQIDEGNTIMLHVHPSVTKVQTKEMVIGAGGSLLVLPLASSNVNESDTVVRIQDGNIVAIGGLMHLDSTRQSSGLPGSTDVPFFASILGNRTNSGRKREVVVLIKPSIIRTAQDWEAQTLRSRAALDDMEAARARVIRIDGTVRDGKPSPAVN